MKTALRIVWKTAPGIAFRADNETLLVEAPPRPAARVPIGDRTVAAALAELTGGRDEPQLLDAVIAGGGNPAVLARNMGLMRSAALLSAEIVASEDRYATALPYAREFAVPAPRTPLRELRLSRFTQLRPGAEGWLLEHPEACCGVVIHNRELWNRLHESTGQAIGAATDAVAETLDVLAQLGFLVDAGEGETPSQRTWEFHDRWFQRRTRLYDDFLPQGSTYRFGREFASPPAIRPSHAGIEIPLPRPAARAGRSLLEVLDARRSRRDMSARGVDVPQISELLYRAARTIEIVPGSPQETLRRPFPAAGGIHELEFYLAAGSCDGLDAGFYHYTHTHALVQLAVPPRSVQAMLEGCAGAWGQPDRPPQAMIVIASRLPRLAWKYQGIAYRLSLLNAGVALQTLSLVCEELGLAGTIAGSGDPRLFAAATKASSWEETSIAEFGFGRRADG